MNRAERTFRRPKVLIVDDEPDVGRLFRSILEKEGIDVTFVTSSSEVLTRVVAEDFDAVLTDLRMPDMDGVTLCERVVASRPDVPVVLFSANGTLETAIAAQRVGAVDFITKPLLPETVTSAVRRAFGHREQRTHLVRVEAPAGAVLDGVVGESASMKRVLSILDRAASTSASILMCGETGTGKEVLARAIHRVSARREEPFVAVNCAAIPTALLESELFGHVKGAFTGAEIARQGLCLDAHRGTLFLDEIGELALESQTKLLRALQERAVRPVGADEEVPFDARIIAATNRDLERDVAEGRFREDLFFRLAVVLLDVPPLRDRGEDIALLAEHFLRLRVEEGAPTTLSEAALEKLASYPWPGNVRELENCIERATVFTRGDVVDVADLPEHIQYHEPGRGGGELTDIAPMGDFAREHVLRVLAIMGGNKTRAAEVLGIDRKTLRRRLVEWQVETDAASEPPESL